MDWSVVYRDFTDLSKEEQINLFEAIKDTLFPEANTGLGNMVGEIRETRFYTGIACVHCGSKTIKRNGKYRTRQRYLCKDCGKSSNDMTASPISGTRYPQKWLDYFQMMVKGYTLPKISKKLKIHISTAFYWRHKILNALRTIGFDSLKGIVESDETFFLESYKGKKNITHRKARKRGGKATKRGISNEQICVVVAQDRNGVILSKMAGRGRVTAKAIDEVMGSYIDPSALLCSDSATNYKTFAKSKGLEHEAVNIRKGVYVKKGIYHIQHVNNYHMRLKKWMKRFQGVATKYLDNYLYWFRFLEVIKKLDTRDKPKSMLLSACKKADFTTIKQLRSA
ncbi:IS1595 family transposase [Aneurinibacillus tyrosinisolvens]|uniref:IS1595 family transposase n=1 Tax=Aneurinibacillus tyrosinisolvens TaxID=1443435 RepID=UPI00063F02A1|nr:IS1595 family transposase [Aneurinibacillus tyrosinisolvens]